MKNKSILRIAAFSTAFIFSAAFAGLFIDTNDSETGFFVPFKTETVVTYDNEQSVGIDDAESARVIDYVLQKDDDNGRARNRTVSRVSPDYNPPLESNASFSVFADATTRYAGQSGKIEQSDLSPEFKSAWRRHMKAWRDYADFLQAMKISSVRNELGADEFSELDVEYNHEINQSWFKVLTVASENGVDVQKYLLGSDD